MDEGGVGGFLYYVRAEYDYNTGQPGDLTFQTGDVIGVRRELDPNWLDGHLLNPTARGGVSASQQQQQQGIFPVSFIDKINLPKSCDPGEVVLAPVHDYAATAHGDLTLVKGMIVLGTKRVDENWWEGIPLDMNGKTIGMKGMFPANFVIQLSAASASKCQSLTQNHSQHPIPARVLENVTAQMDDEISLIAGETVYIDEYIDNLWCRGHSEDDYRCGTFPRGFVRILDALPPDRQQSQEILQTRPFDDRNSVAASNDHRISFAAVENENKNENHQIYSESSNSLYPTTQLESMMLESESSEAAAAVEGGDEVGPPPPSYPPPELPQDMLDISTNPETEPYGITKFPFTGECEGELSCGKGDIVRLVRHADEEWTECEIDSVKGLLPTAYIEIIVDCPPISAGRGVAGPGVVGDSASIVSTSVSDQTTSTTNDSFHARIDSGYTSANEISATSSTSNTISLPGHSFSASSFNPNPNDYRTVLYDFAGTESGDLPVTAGQVITVLRQINADWLEAWDSSNNTTRRGIIPTGFVGPPTSSFSSSNSGIIGEDFMSNQNPSSLSPIPSSPRRSAADNVDNKDVDVDATSIMTTTNKPPNRPKQLPSTSLHHSNSSIPAKHHDYDSWRKSSTAARQSLDVNLLSAAGGRQSSLSSGEPPIYYGGGSSCDGGGGGGGGSIRYSSMASDSFVVGCSGGGSIRSKTSEGGQSIASEDASFYTPPTSIPPSPIPPPIATSNHHSATAAVAQKLPPPSRPRLYQQQQLLQVRDGDELMMSENDHDSGGVFRSQSLDFFAAGVGDNNNFMISTKADEIIGDDFQGEQREPTPTPPPRPKSNPAVKKLSKAGGGSGGQVAAVVEENKMSPEELEKRRREEMERQRIKKRDQRNRVAEEMIRSEKDFVRDAQGCQDSLSAAVRVGPAELDMNTLLAGFPKVIALARELIKSLEYESGEKPFEKREYGAVFLWKMEEFRRVYEEFWEASDDGVALLERYEKAPAPTAVLKDCLGRMRARGIVCMDMTSALSRPLQRVLKYPLFLSELLKCTEEEHPDRAKLAEALAAMTNLAQAINEAKRRKDLVLKYRSNEDPTIGDRISKINLHSFLKKTSRIGVRLSTTIGISSLEKDEEFEAKDRDYKAVTKGVRHFLKDLQTYCDQLQHAIMHQASLVDSWRDALLYIGKDRTTSVRQTQNSDDLKLYQEAWKQILETILPAYFHGIKMRIREPLMVLCSMFAGPDKLILKRKDKLLDYEAASSRREQRHKSGEVTKHQLAAEHEQRAKAEYLALNSQLLAELPRLTAMSEQILKSCLKAFGLLQKTLTTQIRQSFTALDHLSEPVNRILMTFEMKNKRVLSSLAHSGVISPVSSSNNKPPPVTTRRSESGGLWSSAGATDDQKSQHQSHREQSSVDGNNDQKQNQKDRHEPTKTPAISQRASQRFKPFMKTPERGKVAFPKKAQSDGDRQSLRKKALQQQQQQSSYSKNSLFLAKQSWTGKDDLELSVNQGDLVMALMMKDPMGNTNRWYVDSGQTKGFLPKDILIQDTSVVVHHSTNSNSNSNNRPFSAMAGANRIGVPKRIAPALPTNTNDSSSSNRAYNTNNRNSAPPVTGIPRNQSSSSPLIDLTSPVQEDGPGASHVSDLMGLDFSTANEQLAASITNGSNSNRSSGNSKFYTNDTQQKQQHQQQHPLNNSQNPIMPSALFGGRGSHAEYDKNGGGPTAGVVLRKNTTKQPLPAPTNQQQNKGSIINWREDSAAAKRSAPAAPLPPYYQNKSSEAYRPDPHDRTMSVPTGGRQQQTTQACLPPTNNTSNSNNKPTVPLTTRPLYSNVGYDDPLFVENDVTKRAPIRSAPAPPSSSSTSNSKLSCKRQENLNTKQHNSVGSEEQSENGNSNANKRKSSVEFYTVQFDYEAENSESGELSVSRNQILAIHMKQDLEGNDEWWLAEDEYGGVGYVPANYLILYEDSTKH